MADGRAVREVIGFAGQFAAVDPNLTGRENLALTGRLSRAGRKQAKVRAEELLTTQYLDEADALADQVVIIESGRVADAGTPAQLKSRVGAVVFNLGFDTEDGAEIAWKGAWTTGSVP